MVPKGWEVTRLGACVDLMQSGLSRKLSNEDIGLPVIRSGNMEDVETNFDDLKYWYADDPQGADTSIYVLQDEDILVNFINSLSQIGKACIYRNKINRPCIYTTNLLRIKANGKIDNNYLFCQTKTARYDKYVQSITKPAVNQASFTTKEFKMFEFLLPPLPEQRKIAQILSTWDKAITTTERLLSNRQQQKKALMQRLLTGKQRFAGFEGEWKEYSVSQIGKVITGSTPSKSEEANYGSFISWATAEDFKGKYVRDTNIKLSIEGAKKARLVSKGSVLVTCIASIGKNAIAAEQLATNQQINSVEINQHHSNEFFYYLIEFNKHILIALSGSTAVPILNKSSFEKIKFKVPLLQEQQKIAAILSAADTEITTIQNQLDNLKQQKKALMQQLLTGKRRVKVDSPALATQ